MHSSHFAFFHKEINNSPLSLTRRDFSRSELLITLFPPHFKLSSKDAWAPVLNVIYSVSVSPVLNMQVLSLPHFYWLHLCFLTQRSWQLFRTFVHSRSSHWFVLTPKTPILPGVTPSQLMARPQFQAELVSAWLCCIHHSKPVQWECEHVSFICSKAQAACSPLIKYVALQLLKSVTTIYMDCKGDMKLYLKNWRSNPNFTWKGSAAFLSACPHKRFLHWNNLTSARNFDQQGKFHYVAAESLLCVSSEYICWWICMRGLVIFALSPPGIAAVILERQGVISAVFQPRSTQ